MSETDAKVVEARIRVRYAETDQMGVVYHANYLVWFEVGRVEFIRQMGLSYKEMEAEAGCMIAVVEANARYRAPARYDDELVIETRLTAARSSVIRFGYRVLRSGTLLCEGQTVHVVVNREMKKARLPEKYAERFAAHLI
ncbi:acyl-CoA thioesterase [Granulicella arctica]|uniref:acyl-CoA thioesterase n=1 Tax=Granulicella arctica TaxID=940613 RepID=UPI0021E08C4B|nr:thioesterase family protein [Granulicella arctica]